MYGNGNAGTSQTYRANRRAYEKFGIMPRMLVNASIRDLSVGLDLKIFHYFLAECIGIGQHIRKDVLRTAYDEPHRCPKPLPPRRRRGIS